MTKIAQHPHFSLYITTALLILMMILSILTSPLSGMRHTGIFDHDFQWQVTPIPISCGCSYGKCGCSTTPTPRP